MGSVAPDIPARGLLRGFWRLFRASEQSTWIGIPLTISRLLPRIRPLVGNVTYFGIDTYDKISLAQGWA